MLRKTTPTKTKYKDLFPSKTTYIKLQVVRPFSDPVQVGATCTRLSFLKLIALSF
jgi:hypothetical protein